MLTFLYTGCRTQMSKEDLLETEAAKTRVRERFGPQSEERLAEHRAAMQRVLFDTKGTLGKPEWAIKRDERRAAKAEAAARAKAEAEAEAAAKAS